MNKTIRVLQFALLSLLLSQAAAHEDHMARNGGFVMMFLDMHFEIVAPAEGGIDVYYSDPLRYPLPASVVSDVYVEVERADHSIEPVTMLIGDSGEFWTGDSKPVREEGTIVRLAFIFQGEPFVLDIPASVFPDPQQEMDMQMDHSDMDMNDADGEMPECGTDCAD